MSKKQGIYAGYPNPLATPEEKMNPEYGLQYFRKMYADFSGEDGSLYGSRRRRYIVNREYAEGMQNVGKYKKLLGNNGDLSYLSLDWSIVPVIPKFVDVIVGGLTNQDYEIKCTGIDKVAQDAKIQEEMRLSAKMMLQDFTKDLEVMTDIPLGGDEKLPTDSEELELHMQLNYKQAVEIAMEEGIDLCFSINNWKEISKRVMRDLTVVGFGATKTYSDKDGVHVRYVDPANLVISHSNDPDFRDMSHAGEVKYYTIHDIRKMAGNQFTEDEYIEMATVSAGKYDNPIDVPTQKTYYKGYEMYQYDSFRVAVLDGEFKTVDNIRHEKKYNAHGNYTLNKRDSKYKLPKKSRYKREMLDNPVEMIYKGKYIIGTEFIFDYGRADNIIRPKSNKSKVRMSYAVYMPNQINLNNKSLVERMMPFADQIQIAHLKIQQLIAKAKPKGAAFEIGSLENVMLGDGGEFTPLDVQDVYEATGNIYYRMQQEDGSMGNPNPIQELSGGIGGALNELMAIVNYNMQQIRTVTGVNETREGAAPDKEALVGVQKLSLLASNNATRGLNQGYLSIMEGSAKSVALRIQHFVKYNKNYMGYINNIGDMNLKAIEVTADVHPHDFGIIIEALPDEEEKALLENNIQMSLSRDELRIEDAIMLRTIKNVKLANQMLILRRKKYNEEKMEIAQRNSEMNAQIQERAAAAKAQSDAQIEQVKLQAKQAAMQAEFQMKEAFAQAEHQREMERIRMSGDIKTEHIKVASSDIDADLTRIRKR